MTGGKLSLICERSPVGRGRARKRSKSEALLLRSGGYHKEYEAERLTYFCWPLFCFSSFLYIFKNPRLFAKTECLVWDGGGGEKPPTRFFGRVRLANDSSAAKICRLGPQKMILTCDKKQWSYWACLHSPCSILIFIKNGK